MAHDTEAQPWAWVVRGVGGDSECDLEGARNEGGSECDLRSRRRATWNGGTGRLGKQRGGRTEEVRGKETWDDGKEAGA